MSFADIRIGKQVPDATTLPPGLPTVVANFPGQLVSPAALLTAAKGAAVVPGSDVPLTFGGKSSTTIPAGQSAYSDPVPLPVKAFENLTVSFYLPTLTGPATQHTIGNQVSYLALGDQSANPSFAAFVPSGISYYFLSDVDVVAAPQARSVIALGDSITDGLMSTINADHRYPDYLAQRLQQNPGTQNVSVINEGVAGQRLLYDNIGPSTLNSLEPNVLSQPGIKSIILEVGINDLANPPFIGIPGRHPEPISAQQVIDGMKLLISRAHARGVKVFATTITPSGDLSRPARGLFPTYSLPDVVAKRLAVNQFIRTSGAADAVIDFDAAVRDPASPNSLRPDLASADNLHPNDAGYKVLADTVNLSLFN